MKPSQGRPVRSLTETVADAEAPSRSEQQQYQLNPRTEKATLAGEVGGGVGQATSDLATMAASAPAKVAETGSLAMQLAQRLYHTAQVSSLPAARAARDAAQDAIDAGSSPADAASAAASAYNETVLGTLLPASTKGKLATRTASGAALGAGLSASNGGNAQSIVAGAITGGALGGTMGERSESRTRPEQAQSRISDLTDQVNADLSGRSNGGADTSIPADDQPSQAPETDSMEVAALTPLRPTITKVSWLVATNLLTRLQPARRMR